MRYITTECSLYPSSLRKLSSNIRMVHPNYLIISKICILIRIFCFYVFLGEIISISY
jgi:hypothetical protein